MNARNDRAPTPAALRQRLEEAKAAGYGMGEVSVLSARRDPYRLDTPAMHRDGAWLRDQVERLGAPLPIHLRGLHYVLVAAGGVLKPDGKPYLNDEETWVWLSEVAAKAARWLGYLGFDQIVDNRNDAPAIYVPAPAEPGWRIAYGIDVALPHPDDVTPALRLEGLAARQRWRLVLAGEKASLAGVLEPLARRYGAELVLPAGEMSDTLVHGIAQRAAADGRPTVVFYFADADPAGWQMPVSVARKLQAFSDIMPGMEIEVRRVALTPSQADVLNLPSTPLKVTERRADGWLRRFGREQTEIDALAALRPEELRQIVVAAIEPFFDRDLDRRVWAYGEHLEAEANARLGLQLPDGALDEIRARAGARLGELREEIDRLNKSLAVTVDGLDLALPIPAAPEALAPGSPDAPLFTTADDWLTASRKMATEKDHEGEA